MRILALLLFSLLNLSGASWYVDNAATGTRNGTSWANAWTNFASISGPAAGDTVYISGGTVSKTYYDIYLPTINGTAGNPVTYSVGQDSGHNGIIIWDGRNDVASVSFLYGASKNVVVTGNYNNETHLILTNQTPGSGIHLDNSSDVRLEHIRMYSQMRFNPGTNIHIANCYIKPPALISAGINFTLYTKTGDAVGVTNSSVRNCQLVMPCSSNNPAWGADHIKGGTSVSAVSNVFSVYYVTNDVEWEHTDGWQNLTGSNCRVEGNQFYNISNYGIFWEATVAFSNIWIFNNVFANNDSMYHASNLTVSIVVAQRTPGTTNFNIVVANNTIVDMFGRTAMTFGDDPSETNTWLNCVVANNLMYNSGKAGSYPAVDLVLGPGGTNGWSMLNNKAISGIRGTNVINPSQLATAGGDNAIAFTSYTELSSANNFRLLSTDTAAKDVGFSLSSYFTADADGNTRSGTWDLGAYEYVNTLVIVTNAARAVRLKGLRGL